MGRLGGGVHGRRRELIEFLRENDFRMAILSSGLMCLAGRIAKELGVDYVFANELIFDENGVVTGKVNPAVDFEGKGKILRGGLRKSSNPS